MLTSHKDANCLPSSFSANAGSLPRPRGGAGGLLEFGRSSLVLWPSEIAPGGPSPASSPGSRKRAVAWDVLTFLSCSLGELAHSPPPSTPQHSQGTVSTSRRGSLPSFISQEEVLGRGAALGCSLHAGVLLTQFPGLSPRTSGWDWCSDRPRPRPTVTPPVSRLNSKFSLEQGGRTLARGCPPSDGAHFIHSALFAPPAPVAALRKADGSDCGHGSWARGSRSRNLLEGRSRVPLQEREREAKGKHRFTHGLTEASGSREEASIVSTNEVALDLNFGGQDALPRVCP